MKNQNLIVSLEKRLSEPGVLNCGVPQGSILGPIPFLLYVNDMKLAVTNCDLRLYADDTCLFSSNENVSSIEKHLSIHLGEDKTKCILFIKGKKQYPALNITRNDNKIKQYSVVEYSGCLLDEDMSGESITKMALKTINGKTKFLYRQNRYLSYPLKRMLCNSLIQPNFEFACYA